VKAQTASYKPALPLFAYVLLNMPVYHGALLFADHPLGTSDPYPRMGRLPSIRINVATNSRGAKFWFRAVIDGDRIFRRPHTALKIRLIARFIFSNFLAPV
jgi:hypothetical protein